MRTLDDCLHAMNRVTGTEAKVIMERGVVIDSAEHIKLMRDKLTNLGNAAAIVYSHFKPIDGPGETAKALLKMELGLKDEPARPHLKEGG